MDDSSSTAAFVGGYPWPPELAAVLAEDGFALRHVDRLDAVLPLLAAGGVQAVFLAGGPLGASDLLLVRRIRELAPATAVIVVTRTATDPDLKRAFESGATAFLSWPASHEAVRRAVRPVPAPAPADSVS